MSGKTKDTLGAEVDAAVAASPAVLAWDPTTRNSGFTAAANTHYRIEGDSTYTILFPASPDDGDEIWFSEANETTVDPTGAITFGGNGKNIQWPAAGTTGDSSIVLRVSKYGVGFKYSSDSDRWYMLGEQTLALLMPSAASTHAFLRTTNTGRPQSVQAGTDSVLARSGSGSIAGLAMNAHSVLGRSSGSVTDITYAANQILRRGSGNLQLATIADSEFVGRPVGGELGAMTKGEVLAILYPNLETIDAGVQISTAGPALIYTSPALNTNLRCRRFKFQVQAIQVAGIGTLGDAGLWDMAVLAKRNNVGTVTVEDISYLNGPFKDQPAWDVNAIVVGSAIQIQVTGEASKTTRWAIFGTTQEDN